MHRLSTVTETALLQITPGKGLENRRGFFKSSGFRPRVRGKRAGENRNRNRVKRKCFPFCPPPLNTLSSSPCTLSLSEFLFFLFFRERDSCQEMYSESIWNLNERGKSPISARSRTESKKGRLIYWRRGGWLHKKRMAASVCFGLIQNL